MVELVCDVEECVSDPDVSPGALQVSANQGWSWERRGYISSAQTWLIENSVSAIRSHDCCEKSNPELHFQCMLDVSGLPTVASATSMYTTERVLVQSAGTLS